jgi:hypothetical protein
MLQKEYLAHTPLRFQDSDSKILKRVAHPYADEIQSFQLPKDMVLEVQSLVPKQAESLDDTPFLFVDNTHTMKEMMTEI